MIVKQTKYCYNTFVVAPILATERGCILLIANFIISVLASIVAYYICKWLDRDEDND